MSSPEPRPVVPLEYEPEHPRRRQTLFALALVAVVLAVVAVGGFLLLAVGRTQTRQIVISAPTPGPSIPAPGQEQMKSTLLPPGGMEFTLKQRESRWLAGGRLKLSIDDITNGQVLISVSDDAQNVRLGPKSVREGDKIEFSDPDGAPVLLEVLKLTNILIGDDFADFRLSPAAPATRPTLTEPQKIEALLARVADAAGLVFIRNGSEHSADEAADHLRSKWESAGGPEDPKATARDFIEHVGSQSSLSGREYRVRLPDGREMSSADWLGQQLRDIEEPPPTTTRSVATPEPRAHADPHQPAMLSLNRVDDAHCGCAEAMNVALPTLGGKQLWTDVRAGPTGWRIQRHALTGHYRLLDGRNIRRAWGKREHCEEAWAQLAPAAGDPAARKGRELVVLLHGLGRTRAAMAPMASFLRGAGYDVVDFGYASTRAGIDHHAKALDSVLCELDGYAQVHFVGHSLGALVVRRYLAMHAEEPMEHIGRVVMLAPPNQGSALAARLKANPVFLATAGPVGHEIGHWRELSAKLATPRECAVIAGDYRGLNNPLLDGSGDLVVTVEETKLEGMKALVCIDATHTFLMNNPEVMRQSLAFLRHRRFE